MSLLRNIGLGITTGLAALTLALTPVMANAQTRYLYDDFNSGELNTEKWNEEVATNTGGGMLDEHFVEEGAYHAAQLTPADRGTGLCVTPHMFVPGESVEYDINYLGGEGNRSHLLMLNGNAYRVCLFGWWNGVQGNDELGTHQVKVNFHEGGIDMEITRPSGIIDAWFDGELAAPEYYFGMAVRTGHNGTVHMDIDDVYLTTFEGSPVESSSWSSIKALYR
ncbi:MAG: hypothetical protein ABH849_02645 [Nanoarchaeota archaeon]